ncbi:hypothetical protein AVEN_81350-1 [Araneus ventricosus]|uniref:Mariner Mos1 transposase n=1 Tax=Araneus ventricosus TaxID=182803 RepID=A0A4Y2B8K4_ARAVE|nr:hypothetical protein AVEN_81350-1 [Araneus ventricosus]
MMCCLLYSQVMHQSACVAVVNFSQELLRRYVSVDETWIHYYSPETKERSKQWDFRGDPAPKKAKTLKSVSKVMATVFWDASGILYVDYLEKGQTINGEYYASLLHRLREEINEKCPHLAKKKFSSIKTMHGCTSAQFRWREFWN